MYPRQVSCTYENRLKISAQVGPYPRVYGSPRRRWNGISSVHENYTGESVFDKDECFIVGDLVSETDSALYPVFDVPICKMDVSLRRD